MSDLTPQARTRRGYGSAATRPPSRALRSCSSGSPMVSSQGKAGHSGTPAPCWPRWRVSTMDERLLDRIAGHIRLSEDGCWEWDAGKDSCGYGRAAVGRRSLGAHRVVYELLVGLIPQGLQLDHLCRVRHCVNPDHLEPVTPGENYRRSPRVQVTACKYGHPFDVANTYIDPTGRRCCRACNRRASAQSKSRRIMEQ